MAGLLVIPENFRRTAVSPQVRQNWRNLSGRWVIYSYVWYREVREYTRAPDLVKVFRCGLGRGLALLAG